MNLATAFFDPDNDLMVQRRYQARHKDMNTGLFAGDMIDFRVALLELRKTDELEVEQMTL